jgi:hypothetical protein
VHTAKILTIPIDLQIPITVFTRRNPNYLIITVKSSSFNSTDASPADISGLSWHIDNIRPHGTLSIDGRTTSLSFKLGSLRKLNLDVRNNAIFRRDFVGTDLLDYLRSPISEFGEIVTETEDYVKEAAFGAALGIGFLVGLLFLGDKDEDE